MSSKAAKHIWFIGRSYKNGVMHWVNITYGANIIVAKCCGKTLKEARETADRIISLHNYNI